MGIDHGLGGKDGEKSQQKRSKRAARQKEFAQKSLVLVKGKKGKMQKEIIFDETSREKYLTGFRQRKTQRRKFGLAMQVIRDKKEHKDALKNRKNVMQEHRNAITKAFVDGDCENEIVEEGEDAENQQDDDNVNDDEEEEQGEEESEEEGEGEEGEEENGTVYEDQDTQSMFGGSVAVMVDTNMDAEEEEGGGQELDEYIEKQR